jgi:predicted aldo/keto reductase-like oxidoreductase
MSAAAAAGMAIAPSMAFGMHNIPSPLKRKFGKIDFDVTTFGLGGQASLQWTPEGVDPVRIILKAFEIGVNYYDTSNLYGQSQQHYGEAFRQLNLVPGKPNYNKELRESIFLTTKSAIRWGSNTFPEIQGIGNRTQGDHGQGVIGDVKRSLSLMFGDGKGNYPKGAYLDMMLCHNLNRTIEVDALYKGLETPLDPNGEFGALVAMKDFRDGTNYTGLNPENEKLIKHIGFSGHSSAPVLMDMIQRDKYDILEGLLVTINPNDKLYLNMQHNVFPVAKEKGLAIIGMKIFSNGAMYHNESAWVRQNRELVMTVGSDELPSKPLIEYALTTPGIHTLIIGIGHIDDDPLKCQLVQNFYASQIEPDGLSERERRKIEEVASHVKEGKTNYFQLEDNELTPPNNIRVEGKKLAWDTAFAGDEPLEKYEIFEGDKRVDVVMHKPQIDKTPFEFSGVKKGKKYIVSSVDKLGRKADSQVITA